MTGSEAAAIIGPITTLAGALGGVWLTLRYQRSRELRDARRDAYSRWMQFVENLPILSVTPGLSPVRQLNDRRAELDLLGSPKVRRAVRSYIDASEPVRAQVEAALEQLGPRATEVQKLLATGGHWLALEPHKEQVLSVMRRDVGNTDQPKG